MRVLALAPLLLLVLPQAAEAQGGRCFANDQCPAGTFCDAQYGVCVQMPQAQRAAVLGSPRSGRGLITAGAVLWPVSYVMNVVVGVFGGVGSSRTEDRQWHNVREFAFVPLLGPWMQIAALPSRIGGRDGWIAFLVTDGLIQGGAFAMLVGGIVLNARSGRIYAEQGLELELTLGGLRLRGRF